MRHLRRELVPTVWAGDSTAEALLAAHTDRATILEGQGISGGD